MLNLKIHCWYSVWKQLNCGQHKIHTFRGSPDLSENRTEISSYFRAELKYWIWLHTIKNSSVSGKRLTVSSSEEVLGFRLPGKQRFTGNDFRTSRVSFLAEGRLSDISAVFLVTCYIKQFLKLSVDSELVYMIEICYSKQSYFF